MSYFDDWSDDNGYGDSDFSAGPDQADDQSGEPYFQVKTDGPFVGWSDYAMDNLKGSLSPMDFGAFLQDRVGTYGGNNMNQDPTTPPSQFQLDYDPTDYGAPATAQADNTGQTGGSDPGAADTRGYGLGDPNAIGSGPGGWFMNQGLYPNQYPMPGAGFGGQAGGLGYPSNMPGSLGGQGNGWPNPADPLGGYGSGGGCATPGGYSDQTPTFGIDPGSYSLVVGGMNPYTVLAGKEDWTSPYEKMAGVNSGAEATGGTGEQTNPNMVDIDQSCKQHEPRDGSRVWGWDKNGGYSYGPYQLAEKTGMLGAFTRQYPQFDNMTPGSPEFEYI